MSCCCNKGCGWNPSPCNCGRPEPRRLSCNEVEDQLEDAIEVLEQIYDIAGDFLEEIEEEDEECGCGCNCPPRPEPRNNGGCGCGCNQGCGCNCGCGCGGPVPRPHPTCKECHYWGRRGKFACPSHCSNHLPRTFKRCRF